jgi:hypothetical protein
MKRLESGLWSRRGGVEVQMQSAQVYHKRHFGDWGELRRPLPRPPAGLVVVRTNVAGSASEGDLKARKEELRRRRTVSRARLEIYAVEERVRSSLSELHGVVAAAGASGGLKWAMEQYHAVERSEGQHSARACELADFCLQAAERPVVVKEVTGFVEKYGDLIRDFGHWCADTEYGGGAAGRSLYPKGSPLPLLGNERFLWPRPWRRWATEVYARVTRLGRAQPVPPPVGFYVWAALMLTALRKHPEWPGSRLFLANRLASMRLVFGEGWPPKKDSEHKGRIRAWVIGELLDYLALSAAFGWSMPQVDSVRCALCSTMFLTPDGRRRYCDPCRESPGFDQIIAAKHSQRYRDK